MISIVLRRQCWTRKYKYREKENEKLQMVKIKEKNLFLPLLPGMLTPFLFIFHFYFCTVSLYFVCSSACFNICRSNFVFISFFSQSFVAVWHTFHINTYICKQTFFFHVCNRIENFSITDITYILNLHPWVCVCVRNQT